jgi:hypothetical protein
MNMARLAALLAALLLAASARAQTTDERLADVEKKLDAALAEIERLKLGAAASDTGVAMTPRFGFAPSASRVYNVSRGASIGGYGEILFEDPDHQREDDTPSGLRPQADLLRAVMYVGYKFSPELLFNSEMEWEHAGVLDEGEAVVDPATGEGGTALSGEATVEFAYLDWRITPAIGVRAGKLLMPVGLVNEQHEPPVFPGAHRPETEQVVIPSTWASAGAGLYGQTATGFEWRAYLVEGLDARHFDAAEPIRGGRQGGSQAVVTHPALVGRVEWKGTPGLLLGVAGYTGDAWQEARPVGVKLSARVTLAEAHAAWRWRGLELRGLWAAGSLEDAGALSDELGRTGSERLGDRFHGGYAEAVYDVAPLAWPGTSWAIAPYVRAETVDTQESVPGGSEDPALERTLLTFGFAVKPHPSVVLKADREQRGNGVDTETSRWNVALGWLF